MRTFMLAAVFVLLFSPAGAQDPPAINPFAKTPTSDRDDAIPGYVELSDGSVHPGQIYMTRDKRLKLYDEKIQRQREIPLRAAKQIECSVKKEWMEKEWKFKELARDEKMYTGRAYPAREYLYTITLQDDRTITGPLSGILYVQPKMYNATGPNVFRPQVEPEQFILHKRDKGPIGTELGSLVYVKRVKLGKEAYDEAMQKETEKPRRSRE